MPIVFWDLTTVPQTLSYDIEIFRLFKALDIFSGLLIINMEANDTIMWRLKFAMVYYGAFNARFTFFRNFFTAYLLLTYRLVCSLTLLSRSRVCTNILKFKSFDFHKHCQPFCWNLCQTSVCTDCIFCTHVKNSELRTHQGIGGQWQLKEL
jgi:hypothetical protein